MRPVLVNPKDIWQEAEYYTQLSKEEKKIYKKLPKEEQIKAFRDFNILKKANNEVTIESHEEKLESIYARFKEIGVTDLFGTKKEVLELPLLLKENELIMYVTSGLLEGNTYLIVCTDQRLLFLDKGMVYGLKKHEFPLEKINSVSYKTGILFGELIVYHGAAQMTVKNIEKSTVEKMASTVQQQIENQKQLNLAPTVNTFSVADELLKYKQLLDAGVLTQEEFDQKKKELL